MKHIASILFLIMLSTACIHRKVDGPVRFVHNEAPLGADLDIVGSDGDHLFRILLPEFVTASNVPDVSFLNHQMPGEWMDRDGITCCRLRNDNRIEAKFALMPHEKGTLVFFEVRNLTDKELDSLSMDICVSVSHIPSKNVPWINERYIQGSSLPDRDSAGIFWYEKVAPLKLKAFSGGEWHIAHPSPGNPSSLGVPRYEPFSYLSQPARVMAVESSNGDQRLFQAWDTQCRVRCAFPGNSCMHLEPLLAEKLDAGQSSITKGEISLTSGSWKEISSWNADKFNKEYRKMEKILEEF